MKCHRNNQRKKRTDPVLEIYMPSTLCILSDVLVTSLYAGAYFFAVLLRRELESPGVNWDDLLGARGASNSS